MRALVLALLAAASLVAQSGGTVEGHVRNSVTQAGIAGAKVQLLAGQDPAYATTTDDAGAFLFENVKEGEYRPFVDKDGFFPAHSDRAEPRIHVFGKDAVRLDTELAPPATVSGRVLGTDGKPAAGTVVRITSASPGIRQNTRTEENGAFVFAKLRPGAYTLLATPKPVTRTQDGEQMTDMPTYFPSVVEEADAQRITVQGGADLPGYEIRIRSAPMHRIRGRVLDSAGRPAPSLPVLLTKSVPSPLILMAGADAMMRSEPPGLNVSAYVSGENGVFEIPSVPAGEWRLWANVLNQMDYVHNRVIAGNAGGAAVFSKGDVDNVEIRIAAPFTLEASADWGESDAAAGELRPYVTLVALDPRVGNELIGLNESQRFDVVYPGRYLIVAEPLRTPGYYPAAILLGSRDVTGQQVDLMPASPPIKIVYRTDGGTVHGTVEKGEGMIVLLVPQGPGEGRFTLSARCGADGAFVFNDVPPDDYYAAAFERVDMASPGFMSAIVARAARVKVDAKSVAIVDPGVIH